MKLDPAFFRVRRLLDRHHLPLHLCELSGGLLVARLFLFAVDQFNQLAQQLLEHYRAMDFPPN